jgi:CHAT domain-containing protein
VITESGEICRPLKDDKGLSASCGRFVRKIKSADIEGFQDLAASLYNKLVWPVIDEVRGKNRLVIIPDSALTGLPFEALINSKASGGNGLSGNHFLVEDFEVVYQLPHNGPAGTGLIKADTPGDKDKDQEICVIGVSHFVPGQSDAALPGVRRELTQIDSLSGLHGHTFTWANEVSSEITQHDGRPVRRIIHFASHHRPYVQSMLCHHSVSADLVVLNTCSSYSASSGGTEQLLCSPPMMVNAGAANVISTLWNVADNMACRFMTEFYILVMQGESYSTALQATKIKMIGQPETSLPLIWAPYVLLER